MLLFWKKTKQMNLLHSAFRSVVSPLKSTLSNFTSKNITTTQIFFLFWKAVSNLEDKCKVMVTRKRFSKLNSVQNAHGNEIFHSY